MANDTWRDTTTKPPRAALPEWSAAPQTLAMTILWHPDPARVGEVAFFVDDNRRRILRLSRIEPEFAAPGSDSKGPLADAHISRRPLRLRRHDQTLQLEPDECGSEVRVAGELLTQPVTLGREQLAAGMVLELADRIVLLLHLRSATRVGDDLGMVGASDAMLRIRGEVRRLAALKLPVLIHGETGVGKELVARAIHAAGPHSQQPFVPINLSTLPASLAAGQLFGHSRGAFTGAAQAHPGFFCQADGGTLFLDEVGEAPEEVQAMLLRVLEDGAVQPLGAAQAQEVEVRVLAATDRDLHQAVKEGKFRTSLLQRLAGYQVLVPPLRQRRDDIGRLLVGFVSEALAAAGEPDRLTPSRADTMWLPAGLAAALVRYDWPGNVRQLRNVARQLVVSNPGMDVVHPDRVVRELLAVTPKKIKNTVARLPPSQIGAGLLLETLRRHRWQTTATAAALGISRTSLYTLMERHPQIRKAADLSSAEIRASMDQADGNVTRMCEALQVSERGLRLRLRQLEREKR